MIGGVGNSKQTQMREERRERGRKGEGEKKRDGEDACNSNQRQGT